MVTTVIAKFLSTYSNEQKKKQKQTNKNEAKRKTKLKINFENKITENSK